MSCLSWRLFANPVYDSTSPLYFDLSHVELKEAQFSTMAMGGFADGVLEIGNPSPQLIREALDNFLMKRVVATDGAGRVAYEGFIAEIECTLNHHRYVRSMDEFANRVDYRYVYKQGGSCPHGSVCKKRLARNESDVATSLTQTEYGIKTAILDLTNHGITSSAIAQGAADLYLLEMLRARDIDFALGEEQARDDSLTLTLWGYYATLQWKFTNTYFKRLTDIGTVVARGLSKRMGVVWGYPAPFISSDQSNIPTIGREIVYNTKHELKTMQDWLVGVLQPGNNNAKGLFFQVLEDRKPYLLTRQSAARYFSNYDDPRIWDADHKLIPPYLVRAGGYILAERQNESLDPISDIQIRKRTSLVEKTTYNDITDTLSMPPPRSLVTPERVLARARRSLLQISLNSQ